ncbi:hypothetical protein T4B_9533 [Trichinella pseudospiralis]|uniref:Uncharacterized protein n=1 Tax=Trichinella pseudospiralis TaxID=6337 RepID=A0A0V1JL39_TRIPS|nr:hypothetical protein T4A_4878 [Trichinella pseudospiralis]KRZ22610.1 hypothetical protein T4B_9533 [Trichinella pseudospiralis]KRZ35714.1 hypothetical protein T4C_2003 [Trichinella pseudospiralis]
MQNSENLIFCENIITEHISCQYPIFMLHCVKLCASSRRVRANTTASCCPGKKAKHDCKYLQCESVPPLVTRDNSGQKKCGQNSSTSV